MITPTSISPPDSPEDLNLKSAHHRLGNSHHNLQHMNSNSNHHLNHHNNQRAPNHPSFTIDHILSRDSSPVTPQASPPPTNVPAASNQPPSSQQAAAAAARAEANSAAAVAAAAAAAAMLSSPGNEAALLQHAAAARLQSHMFHQTMMNHQSSSAAAMAAAAAAQQHLINVHHHHQQQQQQQQQQHQHQQHHHNPYAGQLGPQFAHLSAGLHRLLHLHPYRKPKRIRTAFSPGQLIELEHAFEKNHYVVGTERKQLAQRLNLTETQVKVWFQNRRTKHKRQKSDD